MTDLIKCVLATDFDDRDFIEHHYLELRVSYFDHVLTEDEYCNAELIAYVDTKDNPDKLKLFNSIQFNSIEQKFVSFYKVLYELCNGITFLYDEKGILPIASYDAYCDLVTNAMKEHPLCTILFPSLGFCSLTGYDLTHVFLIKKEGSDIEIVTKEKISTIANSVDLHVI